MSEPDLPPLAREQKLWAAGAAALFLIAVGFLGFALSTKVMMVFAVGWIALQIFGYVGALRMAKGDFAHPLFKSQVMLHVIALALLVAVFMRAFSGLRSPSGERFPRSHGLKAASLRAGARTSWRPCGRCAPVPPLSG